MILLGFSTLPPSRRGYLPFFVMPSIFRAICWPHRIPTLWKGIGKSGINVTHFSQLLKRINHLWSIGFVEAWFSRRKLFAHPLMHYFEYNKKKRVWFYPAPFEYPPIFFNSRLTRVSMDRLALIKLYLLF